MGRHKRCRAEYSAAVSRLAESWCSCSECTMRGSECTGNCCERAKREQGAKEGTSACKRKCIQMCLVSSCRVCLCLWCGQVWTPEFPLPFGKSLERPASEENSILSCSYAAVNHQAGMSNTCFYVMNKQLSFAFFGASTSPKAVVLLSSGRVSATLPRIPVLIPQFHGECALTG